MSVQALNKSLHNLGIQKQLGSQWLLYSKTIDITHIEGHQDIKMRTKLI